MADSPKTDAKALTDDAIVTSRANRRMFLKAVGAATALSSVSLATAACGSSNPSDTCRNVTDRDPFDTTRRVCDGD
jgi:hypothetical protein